MTTHINTRPSWIALVVLVSVGISAAQNSVAHTQNVPPTARAAASMPRYAAKLARNASTQRRPTLPPRLGMCSLPNRDHGLSPLDVLYDNGPINGTTDAWTINYGFMVSDTFTVGDGTTANGLAFGAWLFPGDVLQSVEVRFTSDPFGGTSYFDGTVSFTSSNCVGNQLGFNVCLETASFNDVNLAAGTYWVTLQNAVVNTGDPVYWDENSGPSLADENSLGTIPSEAFSILGASTTTTTTYPIIECMPDESDNFKVIHNFTGEEDGGSPSGVAIDRSGNLYGRGNFAGGNSSIYKLAQAGTGWILSNLYEFTGSPGGYGPEERLLIGDNGVIYAGASGGLQDCDGSWCGQILSLRPSPSICHSVSCSWAENILYQFSGVNDAFQGGRLASDRDGNLYGVGRGGTDGSGAVFELSPTVGGWIETVIYSFPYGGAHGAQPSELLVGVDGNLYGIARAGGLNGAGVVFQLTRSQSGWTESVIYNIPNKSYFGAAPRFLVQDAEGNLFGIYDYSTWIDYPRFFSKVFVLKPSGGRWTYSELAHGNQYNDQDIYNNLVVDAAGNVWGTAQDSGGGCMGGGYIDAYIFELVKAGDGWQGTIPLYSGNTMFPSSGTLAADSHGNLYGTTYTCGAPGYGTVWEFTPTQ